jgi:hypothetical protein
MKQPFRFFRGEFNGFFLYRLVTFLNHAIQNIIDEIVYQTIFQWKTEEESSLKEIPIRDEDIVNVGKIAGVFQAFGQFDTNIGSIYFTPSHIVHGVERSERGLVDMDREVFEYIRVEADDYSNDIVNNATARKRISVVPPGTEPVGYVAMGTPLFNADGIIIWDNVLPEPPVDTAFVPFFGEKYLVAEERFIFETTLTTPILMLLIECLQKVRYQGPSITLFMEITRILGEGYLYDIEIMPRWLYTPERTIQIGGAGTIGSFKIGMILNSSPASYYEVRYKRDLDADVDNLLRRYAVWQIVCQSKFKLFSLVDVSPGLGE